MNREKLLKHLVSLMFFVFLLDFLAKQFHWYFSVWYFDMLMHFLGGFWVALFFLYVFYDRNPFLKKLLVVILGVLFIGILWEFFEIYLNVISGEFFSISDTLSDIFFDLSGGLCAILYIWKRLLR